MITRTVELKSEGFLNENDICNQCNLFKVKRLLTDKCDYMVMQYIFTSTQYSYGTKIRVKVTCSNMLHNCTDIVQEMWVSLK